jgi:uncharacterized GH25 family protein
MRCSPAGFRTACLVSSLLVSGVGMAAHDLWIEPSAFVMDPGKPLAVRLRVGVDLVGDPVARDPQLIDRFIAVDGTGTIDVQGPDGIDPAGVMRVSRPGLAIVGYSSKPFPIVLTAQKFNEYLAEKGLETVASIRAQRGATGAEAHEQFARCAKALLLAGPAAAAQRDRALGFTLELVAERSPYSMRAGEALPIRLLYRNQPIEGVLVVAMNKRNPKAKMTARSGKDGRVTFRLPDPGMWLVEAVHMIGAPAGGPSEWSSFWASLTFQLPGGSATAAAHGN